MIIKHIYSPIVAGEMSGEALIFRRGVGQLLDEIRQCILQSTLIISQRQTVTKASKKAKAIGTKRVEEGRIAKINESIESAETVLEPETTVPLRGKTGIPGLAEGINAGLAASL